MIVLVGQSFLGVNTVTAPSGFTKRVEFDDTTVCDAIQASPGASGAKVITDTTSFSQTVGANIALKAAATASIPFGVRASGPPVPWHMEL
jgi:hypothetical protein